MPALGILVDIEAAFTHCSKASIGASLWDPAGFVERAILPSSGEILQLLQADPAFDAAKYDEERAARYARREGFY